MPEFHTVVKQVDAMFAHHVLNFVKVREEDLDLDTVLHIGPVYQIIRFGKLPAGIQSKDSSIFPYLHHHIGNCLVLIAQA